MTGLPTLGDKAISWIETYCRNEGGTPVRLSPADKVAIRSLYDYPIEPGVVSAAHLAPDLAAFVSLLHFVGPRAHEGVRLEVMPPPVSVGVVPLVDRSRRAEIFRVAVAVCRSSPTLAECVVIGDRKISCPMLGTTLAA